MILIYQGANQEAEIVLDGRVWPPPGRSATHITPPWR